MNHAVQTRKASRVSSKITASLHAKYFKVLAKFSQFGRFLSSNIEKQEKLSVFMLTDTFESF